MKKIPYSKEESDLILECLKENGYQLKKESFEAMSDVWPGLFNGRERRPYPLFLKTQALIKEYNIPDCSIVSVPQRPDSHHKRNQIKATPKKTVRMQMSFFVDNEVRLLKDKVAKFANEILKEVCQENIELKKELQELRRYKIIVEKNYRKEIGY